MKASSIDNVAPTANCSPAGVREMPTGINGALGASRAAIAIIRGAWLAVAGGAANGTGAALMNVRTSVLSLAMAFVLVATASIANAQPFDWSQVTLVGPSPSPRVGHAMAYDSARGVTVLFGGTSGGSETWEWNGAVWAQRAITGPSPSSRYGHAMAYDSSRGVIVLFGGDTVCYPCQTFRDTWEWDGTTWTQRAISGPSPSSRSCHAMTFDTSRGVTVLFGGLNGQTGNSTGDTWEWDGTTWTQRAVINGPSARQCHAMAYDSARGVTVLVGGEPGGDETWEWNGMEWTQRAVGALALSGRILHGMAFDSARGVTVLVGGARSALTPGETWEWNGNVWTERVFSGGPPFTRFRHAIVYDSLQRNTVLFGGYTAQGVPTDSTWLLRPPCPPPAITTNPTAANICRTSGAVFNLIASAPNAITYRWRKAGVPLDTVANPSAATDTLRLVRVQAADAGLYDCIVSTDCGTATSAAARLTVRTCICLEADIAGGGDAGNEPDGTVDGTDFIAFINSFAIGDAAIDPAADIAGGGDTGLEPDGTIDGTDFIFFINAFAIGC
jgi:hypothetical protein